MCARPLCDCVRGALARQLASHVSVRIVCPEGGRGIRWRAVGGSRRDPPRRCARRVAGRGGPFTVRLRSLGFVCRGARRRVSCCGVHGGAVAGTPSRLRPGRAPREWCGAGGGAGAAVTRRELKTKYEDRNTPNPVTKRRLYGGGARSDRRTEYWNNRIHRIAHPYAATRTPSHGQSVRTRPPCGYTDPTVPMYGPSCVEIRGADAPVRPGCRPRGGHEST